MELQTEQADFYRTQIQAYNSAYKNFSDIQTRLNAQFQPIIAKGPNQFGFSDEELNNLNTLATEGTARGYAKASQALRENVAALGNGTSNINLTSGGMAQTQEQLASAAASSTAEQKLGIRQAGYAQGAAEYGAAVAGEEDLAAGWNPNAFGQTTIGAGKSAADLATTITSEQNSAWNAALGALGGIAGAAAKNVSYSSGGKWTV
jgi:hypothetical protein